MAVVASVQDLLAYTSTIQWHAEPQLAEACKTLAQHMIRLANNGMAPEKPARTDEAKYVVEGGVAVWFKLPGDESALYERISPVIRAAWNKSVLAAAQNPGTMYGWARRKVREACQPWEAFVPVKAPLGSGTITAYVRIAEL